MSILLSQGNPHHITSDQASLIPENRSLSAWWVAMLAGFATAWPALYAMAAYGPRVMIRGLIGDSYHYLAIARKAHSFHIYTYDGVHVTNGFHPLWEYAIRGLFALLKLDTHESEAVAVILMALIATTLGAMLASAAVVRMTGSRFLGLLLVPGLYYLIVGVHVRNLWIWTGLEGMESAFSILFGGLFFFVLSRFAGEAAAGPFEFVAAYRALGWVLPLVILSRLDDFFLLPALLIALYCFEISGPRRFMAATWIAGPSVMAIGCYLIYNRLTVHAAMPLSGGTKAGFTGLVFLYLTAGVHFLPVLELKGLFSRGQSGSDPAVVMQNSFRFVEVIYPLTAAAFGAAGLWAYKRARPELGVYFGLCLFILFKTGYNLLNVHPWHQASWYYAFTMLALSVLGAVLLQGPWKRLNRLPVAKYGVMTVYALVMLLAASQYCASIAYASPDDLGKLFWQRRGVVQKQLEARGVTGILNMDDGITAFLIDMPDLHGFAFATDVEGQRAHKTGRMLTLAHSRGINTIAGAYYMSSAVPIEGDAAIREYLRHSVAWEGIHADADNFTFSLAYYDPVMKMPFFSFKPKT